MDRDPLPSTSASAHLPLLVKFEAALSVVCAVLAVLTWFIPDWIERFFEASPDGGNGETEWGIVLIFAAASLMAGWAARREWRRWRLEQREQRA